MKTFQHGLPISNPNKKYLKLRKKEFINPSIAVAGLRTNPEELLYDLETFGFIFKTLCYRDLNMYSSRLGGKLFYYNDGTLEIDCILQIDNERYALLEFKLADKRIDNGVKSLLKMKNLIKDKIATGDIHIHEPSFLAVITGDTIAWLRSDGVFVIPIGTLR